MRKNKGKDLLTKEKLIEELNDKIDKIYENEKEIRKYEEEINDEENNDLQTKKEKTEEKKSKKKPANLKLIQKIRNRKEPGKTKFLNQRRADEQNEKNILANSIRKGK